MEDITIGGLSMGLGMETNSHRCGLFQEVSCPARRARSPSRSTRSTSLAIVVAPRPSFFCSQTVRAYDVVVASGELVHCTRTNEHADLFGSMAWSCGTLGFLVAVEVELVRVKPYVRATYVPCFSLQEHCAEMKRLALLPEGQTPEYAPRSLPLRVASSARASSRRTAWRACSHACPSTRRCGLLPRQTRPSGTWRAPSTRRTARSSSASRAAT